MNSFYSPEELKSLGLKEYGENVLISRKCSSYGAENIRLGSHVRIDDFCVLSGKVELGNYVHIAASCLLYGGIDCRRVDSHSVTCGTEVPHIVNLGPGTYRDKSQDES